MLDQGEVGSGKKTEQKVKKVKESQQHDTGDNLLLVFQSYFLQNSSLITHSTGPAAGKYPKRRPSLEG